MYVAAVLLTLTACNKQENEEIAQYARTVLVFMSGENDLSEGVQEDIDEMLAARTDARNHCLLVYVDEANSLETPYLARIRNGVRIDSISLRDMGISMGDTCSVDPGVMRDIINLIYG